MAINLSTEKIYALRSLQRRLPRSVSIRTLRRWVNDGVLDKKKRRVKLDHVRHGHEICTSIEAYERFIAKLGGA